MAITKPLVTMIVPYYRQPAMLRKQLETWAAYLPEDTEAFHFVVVDDCSPEPAEEVMKIAGYEHMLPHVSLYRIDKDVPWNRGMARNLGTTVAETEWILHVDTDHVLPPDSADILVKMWASVNRDHWYRFSRFRVGAADETRKKDKANPHATFCPIHPHIDSYLCTKQAYLRAGGYNEDFSGVLGGGSPFLKEMEKANGPSQLIEFPLWVYTRHAIPDSSEHTLPRDPEAFAQRKRDIMKARGTLRGHDPLRLPWHKVF
jgi:hypothetical protein